MSHDRGFFEKFEKTITPHLSKDKNFILKTLRKIFLILWFTFSIGKKVSYLYMN